MVAVAEGSPRPIMDTKTGAQINSDSMDQVDALLNGESVIAFRSEKPFTYPTREGILGETSDLPTIDGPVDITVRRTSKGVRWVQLKGKVAFISYKAGDEESPLFWLQEPSSSKEGGSLGWVHSLSQERMDSINGDFEAAVTAVFAYVQDNREGSIPCAPAPEPHGNAVI